jgi:hypothetical protein
MSTDPKPAPVPRARNSAGHYAAAESVYRDSLAATPGTPS